MSAEGEGDRPLATALLNEFKTLRDKLKNDDDNDYADSPYQNLEKATVLQECRVFHDAQVVTQNPRKCCQLITKMLFLLVRGESFTSTEVTEVFFGVTKLFQSKDVNLRRMMYLFIKEVAETCNPDDVIIVTSSLTKDMNTGEDLYRANSMRVLAKIIDATMLGAIERYLKQAIVDENPFVASSALVAGLSLFRTCPDLVRRWINEVQEAVNSSSDVVQYHALSLLYKIKQHDRLAISKIVQQLSKGSLRSPLATCLLIRYTGSLLKEDLSAANTKNAYQFLENCLRHRNEMVIFEAAKAICNLPNVTSNDLNPAITVLKLYLSSLKPSLRYASMKILSEIAAKHPITVSQCNHIMETLVNDSNRSIATLAITTLLKTGAEVNIDRLMKQISSFMNDIGDEFKVVIIKAIRELCVKFPVKHRVMIGFLATFLREEGGYEFKKSIVDSIVDLMTTIPDTKETCLLHLCEFIEDCEFSELIVQILHIIGSAGPTTAVPSRYIRYVYNRIILEAAGVRAAAVSTLGTFATQLPEVRPSVILLLRRSLCDEDDEVRERAAVLLKALEGVEDEEDMKYLLSDAIPITFAALERSVQASMAQPIELFGNQPICFTTLPVVEEKVAPVPAVTSSSAATKKRLEKEASSSASTATSLDAAAALYKIPEFSNIGRCFRTSAVTPLTENEMEYVVTCAKHIFEQHVVLQFTVTNTIEDQMLVDTWVEVSVDDASAYEVESVVKTTARYNDPSQCYVSLRRVGGPVPASCACSLQFKVVQVNPSTGEVEGDEDGYDEEFPLEALAVNTNDYMAKVPVTDFRRTWESVSQEGEVLEKFALQFKKLEDAVNAVIDFLGMQPVDGTGNVSPQPIGSSDSTAKRTHVLHLSGVFVGNVPVLVRAQFQMDGSSNDVTLKMAVRSQALAISQIVVECIQ